MLCGHVVTWSRGHVVVLTLSIELVHLLDRKIDSIFALFSLSALGPMSNLPEGAPKVAGTDQEKEFIAGELATPHKPFRELLWLQTGMPRPSPPSRCLVTHGTRRIALEAVGDLPSSVVDRVEPHRDGYVVRRLVKSPQCRER